MLLCYLDESGTPSIPGNTSHYVLVGIAIPVAHWKGCEKHIESVKLKYNLVDKEIHTAWILRKYNEQNKIKDFEKLSHQQRISQVNSLRTNELLRLQRLGNSKQYHQTKKNYNQTKDYVHLTFQERKLLVNDIASVVASWRDARLFAECIDKVHFSSLRFASTPDEQAFEQVISRFEQYLQILNLNKDQNHGLLIHDNNQTVAKNHTLLMKKFHQRGTLWTKLKHIIETPLFVNSELTSMIQIADLCSYAMRRYLENGEEELFNHIIKRADRKKGGVMVGVRHFAKFDCKCKICEAHKKPEPKSLLAKIIPAKNN